MNREEHFTRRDWLLLTAAFIISLLLCSLFELRRFSETDSLPGLGVSIMCFAFLGAALAAAKGRLRVTKTGIFLLVCCCLIYLSFALFSDPGLRLIGYLAAFVLTGPTVLCLAGFLTQEDGAGQAVESIRKTAVCATRYLSGPFRGFAGLRKEKTGAAQGLLLGFLISVPVLVVVLLLLSSADAVFNNLLGDFGSFFETLGLGRLLWRLMRAVVFTLFVFSALWALTRPVPELRAVSKPKAGPVSTFAVLLVLLDAVYILFVAVQFACLFGGKETAQMQGGYAEYARTGFFQLVVVAFINLGMAFLTSYSHPYRTLTRALTGLLLVCTAVILVSAAWRMALYIGEYGLSILRALTLWGMLLVAAALAAATWKLLRPDAHVFRFLAAFTLSTWLLFCYSNVDARIADWNVERYLDGRLEQIDIDYLAELGPDTLPALERLRDAGVEEAESGIRELGRSKADLTWAEWSLGWAAVETIDD